MSASKRLNDLLRAETSSSKSSDLGPTADTRYALAADILDEHDPEGEKVGSSKGSASKAADSSSGDDDIPAQRRLLIQPSPEDISTSDVTNIPEQQVLEMSAVINILQEEQNHLKEFQALQLAVLNLPKSRQRDVSVKVVTTACDIRWLPDGNGIIFFDSKKRLQKTRELLKDMKCDIDGVGEHSKGQFKAVYPTENFLTDGGKLSSGRGILVKNSGFINALCLCVQGVNLSHFGEIRDYFRGRETNCMLSMKEGLYGPVVFVSYPIGAEEEVARAFAKGNIVLKDGRTALVTFARMEPVVSTSEMVNPTAGDSQSKQDSKRKRSHESDRRSSNDTSRSKKSRRSRSRSPASTSRASPQAEDDRARQKRYQDEIKSLQEEIDRLHEIDLTNGRIANAIWKVFSEWKGLSPKDTVDKLRKVKEKIRKAEQVAETMVEDERKITELQKEIEELKKKIERKDVDEDNMEIVQKRAENQLLREQIEKYTTMLVNEPGHVRLEPDNPLAPVMAELTDLQRRLKAGGPGGSGQDVAGPDEMSKEALDNMEVVFSQFLEVDPPQGTHTMGYTQRLAGICSLMNSFEKKFNSLKEEHEKAKSVLPKVEQIILEKERRIEDLEQALEQQRRSRQW